MTRAERIAAAAKALLKDYPRPDCKHLHHEKKDRHDYSEECPVERRILRAIIKIETALALPPDPVPRRLTGEDFAALLGRRVLPGDHGNADFLNARIFGS